MQGMHAMHGFTRPVMAGECLSISITMDGEKNDYEETKGFVFVAHDYAWAASFFLFSNEIIASR
jgi:hypothetical protein